LPTDVLCQTGFIKRKVYVIGLQPTQPRKAKGKQPLKRPAPKHADDGLERVAKALIDLAEQQVRKAKK
jgi:hypothetical protein